MPKFLYDKLVRDVVYEDMSASGEVLDHRILDDAEILDALKEKLHEETDELDPSSKEEETLEQLGDLYGVIEAIAIENGIGMQKIIEASELKAK